MNNANYLHLYEEARADALEKMNLPLRKIRKLDFSIFITHLEIDFKKGIKAEEIVMIESSVSQLSRVRSIWKQEIYNRKNELCNTAQVTGVFVKEGKSSRISRELFEHFLKFKED